MPLKGTRAGTIWGLSVIHADHDTLFNNWKYEEITVSERRYGPSIGSHLGKPIYEFFQEQDICYIFDRLAQCDTEGCPLDQVKKNELLLNPGLIYKKAS